MYLCVEHELLDEDGPVMWQKATSFCPSQSNNFSFTRREVGSCSSTAAHHIISFPLSQSIRYRSVQSRGNARKKRPAYRRHRWQVIARNKGEYQF